MNKIQGCESKNHDECRGVLWNCETCNRKVCEEEGTDDHPELCDDCWEKAVKCPHCNEIMKYALLKQTSDDKVTFTLTNDNEFQVEEIVETGEAWPDTDIRCPHCDKNLNSEITN